MGKINFSPELKKSKNIEKHLFPAYIGRDGQTDRQKHYGTDQQENIQNGRLILAGESGETKSIKIEK